MYCHVVNYASSRPARSMRPHGLPCDASLETDETVHSPARERRHWKQPYNPALPFSETSTSLHHAAS